MLCWLRAHHTYDTKYGHMNDEAFEPSFEDRDEARATLAALPGGFEPMQNEDFSGSDRPEPLHFDCRLR